ncbi:MAG: sulfatase-like hydrolase/transferase [Phycisphaerae bacterium]|nr:sulfatase-like hydrolase/transferase [Phycisphaerae bacterium]
MRWVLAALLIVAGATALWFKVLHTPTGPLNLSAGDYNIVLITVDTTRADFIGCYGNKLAATPHIDRLAREGAMFTRCTTCSSLTVPSHASIMTAVYPFVHGVRNNGDRRLAAGITTLAEVLKRAGYSTGAEIASAVLDHKYGLDQGFDTYRDIPFDDHVNHLPERRANQITEAAIEQLHTMKEGKFFLWVHYYDPHTPYQAPGFEGGNLREAYAAEIAFMDAQIGRLLAELSNLGIDRRTLVVLVADHGEGLMEHDESTHGYFVYETTLWVPFIMRCPQTIPAGQVIEAQVGTIDIFPTLLELVGVEPADNVQGISLVPLLSGEVSDLALASYAESLAAYLRFGMSPLRSLSTEGWKYVLAPSGSLYDLTADPGEHDNVIDRHPARAQDMQEQLRALIADAPQPPAREESTITLSAADQARLQSLGYTAGAGGTVLDEGAGEMSIFEPQGLDPHEHAADLKLDTAAMLAIADSNYPLAEKLFRALIAKLPEATEPLAGLARAVEQQGRTDEAASLLRRAVELAPENDDFRKRLAQILIKDQRWAEAIQELTTIIDSSPDDVEVPYHIGLALLGMEQYEKALAEFKRGQHMDPKDVRPIRGMALALSRQGKFAEAEKLVRQAFTQFPNASTLRRDLAVLIQDQGQSGKAIELYRQAVSLNPEDVQVRKSLAGLLAKLGKWDEAFEQFSEIVARQPHDAEALCHKAQAATNLGRYDQALSDYRQARQIDPTNLQAIRGTAFLLIRMRRFADAEELLDNAVKEHPDNALLLGDLAYANQIQGRLDQANQLFQQALTFAPDETTVRAKFAALLVQLKRWEEAVEQLTTVLQAQPDNFEAHYNLAIARGQLGQLDQSRAQFERALQLRPRNSTTLHALGILCVKQGGLSEAADYFRRTLAVDPTNRRAKSDLRRVLEMIEKQ